MISWRPVIPEMGKPAAQGLGGGHDVGLDAPVLHGEPLAGPAHAGLDLVGDEEDAVLFADPLDLAHVLRRRDDEAALALHRLGDDRGHLLGVDLLGEGLLQQTCALAAAARVGQGQRAAVAVGVRDAVDLGRVRPEAHLVGAHLRGEAERHVGAAVEGVLEGDDGLAPRGVAGDLDGVLDRLGAGVHEEGALGEVAGSVAVELLGQLQVGLVAEQAEAHVRVEVGLLLDGLDHLGVAVADVHDADAGGEVDVLPALDVGDDGVSRARRRRQERWRARRGGLPVL